MPRCAVVERSTNTVVNVIVADGGCDPPPAGCTLYPLQDDERCAPGFIFIPGPPNNQYQPPPRTPDPLEG